jgi:membrane fusion protein (multidrug efflux system)
MVGPDRPLLAVVPLDDVWVVANFKEDQLRDMHPGEAVDITVDTFGRRAFRGHVDSLAGASGARFALLPPDNATGNFIKVVQRMPVLIRFDDSAGVEFRPGMSATVTVRTGGR